MAMASSFDQIGPITKNAEDAAIVLSHISGEDRFDSTSAQSPAKAYEKYLTHEVNGLTIGIPKDFMEMEGLATDIKEEV
jgi:aspartyl-tRNA(Asn)/glutamyl-tRNA(Gln) amidotransferase subunit A